MTEKEKDAFKKWISSQISNARALASKNKYWEARIRAAERARCYSQVLRHIR